MTVDVKSIFAIMYNVTQMLENEEITKEKAEEIKKIVTNSEKLLNREFERVVLNCNENLLQKNES